MNGLQVVTFNLRVDTRVDGENRWDVRKDFAAAVVREMSPDILGTQEAMPQQARYLEEQLGGHARFGAGRHDGVNGEANALFLRKERFEPHDSGDFWLSETPGVPGSMGWDAAYSRLATWVVATDLAAGRRMLIVNTHLDNKGEVARLEGVRMLKRWIIERAVGMPVVLMGDFNCTENDPPVREMLRAEGGLGFVDAYRAVHPEVHAEELTLNKFQGLTVGLRIDFIFHTRELAARSAGIIRTAREGRYPSDHYPVSVGLEWL
jgi:endonuclease/exonuclease/phosphatase family metal-dependent hydrolase